MRSILLLISLLSISACSDRGDPGRAALQRFECGACHVIPGVAGARGQVGPPLDNYSRRVYIAGKFPRDEALLARWIADAPSLSPGTAMPKIEMTPGDARAIAVYLYSLK
jgi:cytochrome c